MYKKELLKAHYDCSTIQWMASVLSDNGYLNNEVINDTERI